jgi:CSLREA domain-containing protein
MSEQAPRNRAERRAASKRSRAMATAMTATKVGAVVGTAAVAAFATGAAPAGAATFTVTTTADGVVPPAGSLREAIISANGTPGDDIINFDPSVVGEITLTAGQLDPITEGVDIQGPGAGVLTVRGTGTERIFYIDGSGPTFDVTISGLTLTHDATTVTGDGGAIYNDGAHLTVRDAVVTGNEVDGEGGGISSEGDANALRLENTTLTNNVSDDGGGAVNVKDERADVQILNSTITGNETGSWGGALYFYSDTGILNVVGSDLSDNTAGSGGGAGWWGGNRSHGTLMNSTVSGNTAEGSEGGGIAFYTDSVHIENSTISNNTAESDDGGGLYLQNNQLGVEIHNSVISGNHAYDGAGGGIFFYYTTGIVNVVNTTISGNTADYGGGGAYFYDDESGSPGKVTIRNSTISNNSTGGDYEGGGLYITYMLQSVDIFNSTISGNTAGGEGGGISFNGYYGLQLVQNTITNNNADNYGGLYLPDFSQQAVSAADAKAAKKPQKEVRSQDRKATKHERVQASKAAHPRGPKAQLVTKYEYAGETTSIATIIAGNSGTDVGPGSVVHSDHSLFGTVAAGTTVEDLGGTQIGTNPNLGPLQNNGGPTETHALLTGSAAIDTGLTTEPPFPGNEYDQRGPTFFRIEGGVSDIGAYEVQVEEVIITPRLAG